MVNGEDMKPYRIKVNGTKEHQTFYYDYYSDAISVFFSIKKLNSNVRIEQYSGCFQHNPVYVEIGNYYTNVK